LSNLAGLPLIAQRAGSRLTQPQAGVHAPQQQRTALGAQITAAEIRLDDSPLEQPEIQLLVRTRSPRLA
jgi:hypothetical protein